MTGARRRLPWQASGYQSLRDVPGVGASIADDYARFGISDPHQLAAADPLELFDRLELIDGLTDRCVLYVFRCARYAVSTPDPDIRLLDWWAWKLDHGGGTAVP